MIEDPAFGAAIFFMPEFQNLTRFANQSENDSEPAECREAMLSYVSVATSMFVREARIARCYQRAISDLLLTNVGQFTTPSNQGFPA